MMPFMGSGFHGSCLPENRSWRDWLVQPLLLPDWHAHSFYDVTVEDSDNEKEGAKHVGETLFKT